ncbi:UrvD/REP family ATP-dependent DNA helicase [Brevibacterium album]|uniref:UrvD/REP family ATP-dependent DNA helicase n=1 Tax=Brevibacterium album TaxID=417948 RepID=UPI00041E74F7|nr:UrvD/REP family ATP-dependent DNA helicase [Brevibacterium album]
MSYSTRAGGTQAGEPGAAGLGPEDAAGPAGELAQLLLRGKSACVAAVPGTGVTSTLVAAHTRLLSSGSLGPDDVLVLTPNRAHADALRDRVGAGERAVRTGAGARSVHSLAFGLVSAETAATMGEAARFLSGADQDAILGTLLEGFDSGRVRAPHWPEAMNAEMRRTDAFRDQLREALDAVLIRGIAPVEVEEAAREAGRGEWLALAQILQDYRDQLSFPGYGGVDTAGVLAEAAAIVRAEAAAGTAAGAPWSFSAERVPRCVLVDAAQDVPDAAFGLLEGLTRLGCAVAVLGSPDASTQGFRGAGGLVPAWSRAFATGAIRGRTLVLPGRTAGARGAGPVRELSLALSRRLSAHLLLGHVPPAGQARDAEGDSVADSEAPSGAPGPDASGPDERDGHESALSVIAHASSAERTRHVARLIRTWHHDEGVEFSDIAVITRTNGTAVSLRSELGALGLPVESTDLPLAVDPATAPLLALLTEDLADDAARAKLLRSLLGGVYGGVDALALRGMEREAVRVLRQDARAPGTDALLTWADAVLPAQLPAPLARAAALLEAGRRVRGASPHSALWTLWETSGAAAPWRAEVLRDPRSPLRERLDAVVRLFALARKLEDTVGLQADAFASRVQEQVYAQDSLGRTDSLDLVTVDSPAGVSHRSFSRVVVVDVDEGHWPNPRIRRNAFQPADLLAHLADPEAAGQEFAPGEAVQEARRRTVRDEGALFLAAVSRARDELVVCALDDGETSPSAFHHIAAEFAGGAATSLSRLSEKAGEEDGETEAGELVPARLRDIVGLARQGLLTEEDPADWAALVAALEAAGLREAGPSTWSTWHQPSSTAPARGRDETLRIRPSQVEAFATCPLQWFLTDSGGRPGETVTAASLGTAMHQVAEHHPEPDRAAMLAEFDEAFDYSLLASEWERDRTRRDAETMVDALIDYLRFSREDMSARAERLRAAGVAEPEIAVLREAQVRAASPEVSPGGPWRIGGRADRLERVGDTVRVIDFKTGQAQPSAQEARDNPQLRVYQYALADGEAVLPPVPQAGEEPGAAGEATGAAGGGPVSTGGATTGTGASGPESAVPVRLRGLEPAGAALVHLRKGPGAGRGGLPSSVREQPAMDRSSEEGAQMHEDTAALIDGVAAGMRLAQFPATPGRHCEHCPVRSSCPAMTALTADGGEG